MITRAQIEKLGARHKVEPTMFSPYLAMPPVGRPAVGLPDACCPDWGVAAMPVPDVIEEMVSRVLQDGGDVLVAGGGWSRTGEPAPPAGPASWVV